MTTPGSKRPYDDDGALWVHGLPARSYEQVADYLNGDAHDRSKVQVMVGGVLRDVFVAEKGSL